MTQVSFPIPSFATARRWGLRLLAAVVLIYIAYLVRAIWMPLGLAVLLAMVLDPVVDRMERRGWNRTRATAFIFVSFLIITVGLVILAAPYVLRQAGDIQRQFELYFPDQSHKGLLASFHRMNVSPALANVGAHAIEAIQKSIHSAGSPLATYGLAAASNLVGLIVIPIIAFYFLRDFHIILAKALLIVPGKHRSLIQTCVAEVTAVFGRYLRGLAIVSGLNGLATGLLLWVLHVPSALLLGVVAGMLYGVPYIGAIFTVVFTAGIAFVGGGIHLMFVAVVASFFMHQILFDQLVTPRILGKHVGLHPILSIIALLIGNALLGVVGMILAVPVAACIQMAIVAVEPKLAVEVQLPAVETVTQSLQEAEDSAEDAAEPLDASAVMREAVATAVADIEQQAEAAEAESAKSN